MEFFCNFIWEQGQRIKNEDSLSIQEIKKDNKCYIMVLVCDGVGGLQQGEDASTYVAHAFRRMFFDLVKNKHRMPWRKVRNIVYRKIYQCHKKLQIYGNERQIQLGTTLSMILIIGKRGYLFHVGDSAVFYGKKKLKRLTPIQHTDSGALVQAIGTFTTLKITFKKIRVHRGCVILLASDGFYQKCEKEICKKEWIQKIACDEKKIAIQLQCTKDVVQKLGEKDNISAICIKVQ